MAGFLKSRFAESLQLIWFPERLRRVLYLAASARALRLWKIFCCLRAAYPNRYVGMNRQRISVGENQVVGNVTFAEACQSPFRSRPVRLLQGAVETAETCPWIVNPSGLRGQYLRIPAPLALRGNWFACLGDAQTLIKPAPKITFHRIHNDRAGEG